MIYPAIAREIYTRLTFHQKHGIGDADPILKDFKITESGEFRLTNDKDLPEVTLVDLTAAERTGNTSGRVTLFLKTRKKAGWVSLDPDAKAGLLDCLDAVLDAIEIAPSTGDGDPRFILHKLDGTAVKDVNGADLTLLSEDFQFDVRMSEITDLSFMMEIDVIFVIPLARRGKRRTTMLTPSSYQTV